MEIGLIGSGSIAHEHVPALEAVGMDITAVASMNPESNTVEEFGSKFGIENVYKGQGWKEMISTTEFDGVVIATHISGTPEAVKCCLNQKIPILVEKPVGWSSDTLHELRNKSQSNVIVGYNRRYYNTVQSAKEFVAKNHPVMATIELPAASDIDSFISMSSHGIDILRFIFEELTVLDTHRLMNNGDITGFSATISSKFGDLINVIGNWKAPSNIGLNIDHSDLRFQLEPYEHARKYKGFRIEEPSDTIPIRRYIPQIIEEIDLQPQEDGYKPGFYDQALSFKNLIQNSEIKPFSATLYDAEKNLELCERLLPQHLPKTD